MGMQASSMAKYVSMQGLEENRGAREEGLWQKPLRFESDRPNPIYKLEARPPPTWDFLRATQQQTSNIFTYIFSFIFRFSYLLNYP